MTLVYAMETGRKLHDMKRGTKNKFFAEVEKHRHWTWLIPYEEEIDKFDTKYRTAEVHKGSVLRAKLFDQVAELHNEVLGLLNHAMNQLWDNLLLIAQGVRDPKRFDYGLAHLQRDEEDIDAGSTVSETAFARKTETS